MINKFKCNNCGTKISIYKLFTLDFEGDMIIPCQSCRLDVVGTNVFSIVVTLPTLAAVALLLIDVFDLSWLWLLALIPTWLIAYIVLFPTRKDY